MLAVSQLFHAFAADTLAAQEADGRQPLDLAVEDRRAKCAALAQTLAAGAASLPPLLEALHAVHARQAAASEGLDGVAMDGVLQQEQAAALNKLTAALRACGSWERLAASA